MNKSDTIAEAIKSAPPVGVAGLTVFGVPLADGVLVLTALYTIFLLIDKLPTVVERFRQLGRWLKGPR